MSLREGRPLVIGVLGGIASGKTALATMFARLGARVVAADAIAHRALAEAPTRERIAARWGPGVLAPDGSVDRRALADRVFGRPDEVAALAAITHPVILAHMRRQIDEARRSPTVAAIVLDAPLLLEAGLDELCDVLVFADCPRRVRAARVRDERGWDSRELQRREGHQRPLAEKRALADYTVDTSLPPETTYRQVQQLWQRALGL